MAASPNQLSLKSFLERLLVLSPFPNFFIAYSGGLDSHVLLHLCARAKQKQPDLCFRSVYVDHGLQPVSAEWGEHCRQQAQKLGIPHANHALQLQVPKGESTEAYARQARYRLFAEMMRPEEALLTAQHQDDQLETVLLQLFRGAGLDGLAAMPDEAQFGEGVHVRPLLPYPRSELEAYATEYQLDYVTDPSNADKRYDRNYLRNEVIPSLKRRWPALGQTVARAARLQAEAAELINSFLLHELPELAGSDENTLSVTALKALDEVRLKAVLRYWIKQSGFKAPSAIKLQHLVTDVLQAGPDAMPELAWQGCEIRRFRDNLYIMQPLADPGQLNIDWDLRAPLSLQHLPQGQNVLRPKLLEDLLPKLRAAKKHVSVRYRRGGETIRPRYRGCAVSLKNLFQQAAIPPWQRERTPLIYVGQQLICVPGLAIIDPAELELD